jgi:carbon monoxide dehydrogenase subunit G
VVELAGTIVIDATPERVWRFLLDPREMKACLPYCDELEAVDETSFRAVVTMKVSVIECHFGLRTLITERRPFELLRTVTEGEDRRLASLVRQENEVQLRPAGNGATQFSYRMKVDVSGRLGRLGLTVLSARAKRMATDFVECLKWRIESTGRLHETEAQA